MNINDIINAFFGGDNFDEYHGHQRQNQQQQQLPQMGSRRSAILKSAKLKEEQIKHQQEAEHQRVIEERNYKSNPNHKNYPQWDDLEKNVEDPTIRRNHPRDPFDHPFFTGRNFMSPAKGDGDSHFSSSFTSKSSSYKTLPDGTIEKIIKICDENGCRTETEIIDPNKPRGGGGGPAKSAGF